MQEFRQSQDAEQASCPLCRSQEVLYRSSIDTASIVGLYGKEMQAIVREEFKGTDRIDVQQCQNCYLLFFHPQLAGSPTFYQGLQSFDWYYLKEKEEYEMAKKWMQPNTRLLEVGCGAGWFGRTLREVQYTGLEYSQSAVKEARANGLNVINESVEHHALQHPAAYRVVCAFQVLEHVSDPGSFINACLDCLEPGGLLIFAVPSNDSYLRYLQNAVLNIPPHHITRWSDKTLEAIAGLFSLDLVALEHESASDVHLQSCVNTIIKRKLNVMFGRGEALIDRSLASRLLARCAGLVTGWSTTILQDPVLRPRGHTVIVAYRKRVAAC